jgi:cell division protein FtsB
LSGLIGKLIIGVSALAATCSFAGFVVKGLVPLYQAKKKYDAEVQKVGVWMEKNTKLIEEISRLKDDSAYIEQLIRENYGYVRQDEAFYQIGGQELKGNR